MPIHTVSKDSAGDLGVDIYAAELACEPLPKRRLADAGVPGRSAFALIRDELIHGYIAMLLS